MYHLNLPDVLLANSLKASLQEIPKDKVYEPIHQEKRNDEGFREEAEESEVLIYSDVSVDLVGPCRLERCWGTKADSADESEDKHNQTKADYYLPLVHSNIDFLDEQADEPKEDHEHRP